MSDPCFSTALGRAIVAYLPLERQAFLLRNALIEKRTPMTVVDPKALKKVLEDVRTRGIAEEENQTDVGVMCIAAPVFDADGVVASISLTARIDEITADQRPSGVPGSRNRQISSHKKCLRIEVYCLKFNWNRICSFGDSVCS